MSGIFISYRRDDSGGSTGHLSADLSACFGPQQLFRDIDKLEPGVDFVESIEKAVGSCDVLIAVIGRQWVTSTDAKRQRRLDDPEDYVRLEIAAALNRNILVIPVLVDGATMPQPQELPDALAKLVRLQAQEISESRWEYDVGKLIKTLEGRLGVVHPVHPPPLAERFPISKGLMALAELMENPEVRGILGEYQATFRSTSEQIAELESYKTLHDDLQKVELSCRNIYDNEKKLETDPEAWDYVERDGDDLQEHIDKLFDHARKMPFATEETLWMEKLVTIKTRLQEAIEQKDSEHLKSTTRNLRTRILDREPPRINAILVKIAARLHLRQKIEMMCSRLKGLTLDTEAIRQFQEFERGAAVLAELEKNLGMLCSNHNHLQDIDDELRRTESALHDQNACMAIEDAWREIQPSLKDLRMGSDTPWATKLTEAANALKNALLTRSEKDIIKFFKLLRRAENSSFHTVDTDLKELCQRLLKEARNPLNDVLERMPHA